MSKIICATVMFLAASFHANASETRQVVYHFGPGGVPSLTHVICDDCPPAAGLRGIPVALKMNVVRIRADEAEKVFLKTNLPANGGEAASQTPCIKDEKKTSGDTAKIYTVYFELNDSAVKATERERLLADARYLATGAIEITGYTCDLGSQTYNDSLAMKRAEAVSEILASAGIERGRMRIAGKGRCCYTGLGRELDRRVEIMTKEEIHSEKGSD